MNNRTVKNRFSDITRKRNKKLTYGEPKRIRSNKTTIFKKDLKLKKSNKLLRIYNNYIMFNSKTIYRKRKSNVEQIKELDIDTYI